MIAASAVLIERFKNYERGESGVMGRKGKCASLFLSSSDSSMDDDYQLSNYLALYIQYVDGKNLLVVSTDR